MVGVTLAFSRQQLDDTRVFEELIDIIFLIDMIITFFTAYYHEVNLVKSPWRICRRYFTTYFVFDVVATLPTLFSYQNEDVYICKIFRVVRLAHLVGPLLSQFDILKIDKLLLIRIKRFTRLIIILIAVIHILACCWVYIGRKQDGSWIDVHRPNERFGSNNSIYIAAVYWVVTTLTTVGYGDFKGYTINEYMFQCGVEFLGIGVFALFMDQVSGITENEEDKLEYLDWWLYKLDSTRGEERLPGPLYYSIKRFVEASIKEDFNMIIEDYDFYYQLKPNLRYELINELFNDPLEGRYQEKGFIADFIVNLYCRVFIPGQDIVKIGETFEEMYIIKEGGISVITEEEFGNTNQEG